MGPASEPVRDRGEIEERGNDPTREGGHLVSHTKYMRQMCVASSRTLAGAAYELRVAHVAYAEINLETRDWTSAYRRHYSASL